MEGYITVLFGHNAFGELSYESAWVKILKKGYMLDNVLFYAKEYSWGDSIKVISHEGEYYADGLINESGHSTVRILFSDLSIRDEMRKNLIEMGCSSELSNVEELISVDIPVDVDYNKIRAYLEQGEQEEKWEYEEGCISYNHRK